MRRKTWFAGAGALAAGALVPRRAWAQAANVVTIGYTGPLSGGAAQYGADVQRGIQMAIDEINAAGGAGAKKYTFKLASLDDAYRPNEAATNAKRLAQESNAPIVFCPHSGGILAIEDFNDKQSPKFVLGAYTSEPAILKKNDTLMLMIPPAYDGYFKPFGEYAMKRFGKKLGLIATTTAYGNAWTKGFSAAWQAMGGTVLTNNGVDYNTTADFSTTVSKALAEKPDAILVGGPSQPTGLVMKSARDQGYNGGFVMMDQAKFDQLQSVLPIAKLEGAIGVVPFPLYPGAGTKIFIDAYTKKFGTERAPNTEIAFNYMAMHVFAEAIALANSADPAALAGKLHDAAKDLNPKYQPATIHGVTKAGHLMLDAIAASVDKGKYDKITIPFTE